MILCQKMAQIGDKQVDLAAAIDKTVFPGDQGGPLVHMIAAKAVCFHEAMQPEFKDYARQIVANAKVLAETLAAEGFRIISGGTDTHLMLVDVFSKGMLGSEAEKALGEAGITVNKNAIPFDTNPPMKPSGIRIGTPALTTRGMKEDEMRQIGRWIAAGAQQPHRRAECWARSSARCSQCAKRSRSIPSGGRGPWREHTSFEFHFQFQSQDSALHYRRARGN